MFTLSLIRSGPGQENTFSLLRSYWRHGAGKAILTTRRRPSIDPLNFFFILYRSFGVLLFLWSNDCPWRYQFNFLLKAKFWTVHQQTTTPPVLKFPICTHAEISWKYEVAISECFRLGQKIWIINPWHAVFFLRKSEKDWVNLFKNQFKILFSDF